MTALIIVLSVIALIILLFNFPVTVHVSFYDRRLKIAVKYLGIPLLPRREKPPGRKKRKRVKTPSPSGIPEDSEDIFEDIAEIGFPDDDPDIPDNSANENVGEADVTNETENTAELSDIPDAKEAAPEKNSPEKSPKDGKKWRHSPKEKPPKKQEKRSLTDIIDDLDTKKDAAALLWELCGGRAVRLLKKIRITGVVIDFAAANEDAAKAAVTYGAISGAFYYLLGTLMSVTPIGISSINIDCLYNTPADSSRYNCEAKIKLRPASLANALVSIGAAYLAGREKYKPALGEFTGKKS